MVSPKKKTEKPSARKRPGKGKDRTLSFKERLEDGVEELAVKLKKSVSRARCWLLCGTCAYIWIIERWKLQGVSERSNLDTESDSAAFRWVYDANGK